MECDSDTIIVGQESTTTKENCGVWTCGRHGNNKRNECGGT